jgi:peptide deformylase
MAILEIVKYPDPILKKKTQPISHIDEDLRRLVADMAETMYSAPGVGLAAPQVGSNLRVAVLDVTKADDPRNLIVLINPEILAAEGECKWEEGCLSIPDCNEEVKRMKKVFVRFQNLQGEQTDLVGEDLLGIALQHEIDHLDGILFIDRLSRLKRDFVKRRLRREAERE